MKNEKKLSPMMTHYMTVKERYPDAILMFRLGDFYEMFFQDAVTASSILDLTLTGRDCGLEKRAEMCGVPYHAVDTYVKKLIDNGCKVAICDQMNTPEDARGKLVDREVVRVVTPGTVIDDTLLDDKTAVYTASVFIDKTRVGLAYADMASGEFKCRELDNPYNLEDCLLNINAAEIIASDAACEFMLSMKSLAAGRLVKPQKYHDYAYKYDNAEKKLKRQFNAVSLEAFGLSEKRYAVAAAGALMEYFTETQKRGLPHFNKIVCITEKDRMLLDNNARRNLELTETARERRKVGTLLWLLDKTVTNMGARKMKEVIENPLLNSTEINGRLDAVDEFVKNARLRDGLAAGLKRVRDLERLSAKIAYGNLNPRDCAAIAETLRELPAIKKSLASCRSELLKKSADKIMPLPEIGGLLLRAIAENPPALLKDGGYINDGYNAELDEYRNIRKNGKALIVNLETAERAATGIKNLKVGFNKVFGYYIEVTSQYKNQTPFRYIRKQTTVNGERYVTEELKELEDKILSAEERSLKIEAVLFTEIKSALVVVIPELQITASALALCDVLLSFGEVSAIHGFSRPVINESIKEINITGGAHPVIRALISRDFIPNDVLLDCGKNRTLIITGPNMAGKSTYMRQVAVITVMAHIGCFVSAVAARISLTDRIFTRVGASDDLGLGQSTFMTEMIEASAIINNATENSLLILDEIGRGTSTYDGMSIAWAILEYISGHIKAKTLFSTHYHEIAELEGLLEGVKNYKILVKEVGNGIQFLYKIARGGANKSFGVKVASLAGLPKEIIERAEVLIKRLEASDINKDTNALMLNGVSQKNAKQISFIEEIGDKERVKNEIFNIIKDTNPDTCSPLQALTILTELKERTKGIK
ncbi:MAG: DNA mismatch repair protein MutS [Clostridiales bacterium]|jgi:DNA mismatch repair protein MutS|nr:DNA mismatch repair protein MutS [Clostridiales bacterium]